ncbi:S41 family peptidase [Virgibacillus sp. YIM 98842]|uniref:S41 family peptidase n=1 Tax=Virgibacillus sp. YIM 98842 TaxID=2663533 RepID=UPI0013DA7723|nr:S41 family peptidase [Virgibacillus sp. YIM 98842]
MQAENRNGWVHDTEGIIYSIAKLLKEHYVFPDIAKETARYLEHRLEGKDYEAIKNPETFSGQVTRDLQKISNDKHLKLTYTAKAGSNDQVISDKEQMEKRMLQARINNFGFHKVERLQGNIGYIDLREFHDPKFAAETAASAMNLVANTEALIFDLRNNGGGSPSMVAFLISYLFDCAPFHLSSFYTRQNDFFSQSWTLSYVPGKRYGDNPIYVLTSRETFSGAEEFAYNLKNLQRATIIGEATKGGANPGTVHQLTRNFSVFIPDGQAINPITQTNWEGKGVTPDIQTTQGKALETAYAQALQHIMSSCSGSRNYQFLAKEAETRLEQLGIAVTEK